ncbi:MAG: Ig-like domain-containing protein [Eubacteriaceae bacterium]|jgi:hypothetical protein
MKRKLSMLVVLAMLCTAVFCGSALASVTPAKLKISAPSVLSGEDAVITVSAADKDGAAITTGSITVTVNSTDFTTTLTVKPDKDGTVTLTLPSMPAGSYEIDADYCDTSLNPVYSNADASAVLDVKVPLKIYEAPQAEQKTWAYGTTLSQISLSGGIANVSGTFSWKDPDQKLTVGKNRCAVVFTPDDSFYSPVEFGGDITVTIVQDTPVLSNLSAAPIDEGDTLSASNLTGTAVSKVTGEKIPGTFTFADPNQSIDSETDTVTVVFTPDDTVNYKSVTGTVAVAANKGKTSVTDSTVHEQQAVSENTTTETIDGNDVQVISSADTETTGSGNTSTAYSNSQETKIQSLASSASGLKTFFSQSWVFPATGILTLSVIVGLVIFRKKII